MSIFVASLTNSSRICGLFVAPVFQTAVANRRTKYRERGARQRGKRNIRTCLQFVSCSRKYNLVSSNMFSNLLVYASTCVQKRPPFSSPTLLSLSLSFSFFPGFIFFHSVFRFLFSKYPRKFHYVIAKYFRELRVRFDPFRLSL